MTPLNFQSKQKFSLLWSKRRRDRRSDIAYCPNCKASISSDASGCASCGADFSAADGWRPVDAEGINTNRSSGASIILKLGVASVVLPAAAFVLGALLWQLIPGCRCDSGAGCHGCGIDGLVAFLLYGGFTGALAALVTLLPVSIMLAAIVGIIARTRF